MKLVYRSRYFFQFVVFLSILSVIGSVGAWETGAISFGQMAVQLIMYASVGFFCARASKKRFVLRFMRRKHRVVHPRSTPITSLHAA